MDVLTQFGELLKEYDIVSILILMFFYIKMKSKIDLVDKAVNNRPVDGPTLSEEVTQINHKFDLLHKDLKYVRKEIDLHRETDEKMFETFSENIKSINERINTLHDK